MAFIQEWLPTASRSDEYVLDGPSTAVGNTLFMDLFVRSSEHSPVATVTDGTSNTWSLVGEVHNGPTNMYTFVCHDASSVNSVTASWADGDGQPTDTTGLVVLSEYSDVGVLTGVEIAEFPTVGGQHNPFSLGSGQFIRAFGGTGNTTRSWELVATGVTATERTVRASQQRTMLRADAYADSAVSASLGWDLVSGNDTTFAVIGAAFDAPQALSVDAGENAIGYVGYPVSVIATASGGSGAKTYAWTSDSPGDFADSSSATTTYVAQEAGDHILTCTVTDDTGTVDDSLTLTAQAVPVEDFVSASGWTSVVGASETLDAITDQDDETYVATAGNPNNEVITLTLPSMVRPTSDLVVPLRVSAPYGAIVLTPTLHTVEGPIVAAPVNVTSVAPTSATAVFPLLEIADTTGWGSGLTITITASTP